MTNDEGMTKSEEARVLISTKHLGTRTKQGFVREEPRITNAERMRQPLIRHSRFVIAPFEDETIFRVSRLRIAG